MAQHLLTVKFFLLAAGLSVAQCASVAHSQNLAVRQDDLLASGIRRPPQAPCVYNDTVASIQQKAVDYNTTKLGVVKDILASVTPETATFDNVLLPFLQNEDLTKTHMWPTSGYYLGANDDLAAAIDEMWDSANNAFNAVFTNPDFFALVDAIYKANDTSLSEENIIVTAKVWADFAGSGLNIPAGAERDRYHNISDRISDIRSEFNENLSNAKVIVYFTADELEGVPAETLASLKNGTGENAGKYEIDIALYQNYGEIVPYAINETTRYTCLVEQNNKAPENVPLLAESLELRFEEAQIFNYSTWSDYTISANIAKTAQTVNDFLEDLRQNLQVLAESDLQTLNAIKANETEIVSPIGDTDIVYLWDTAYYTRIETKRDYSVDADALKAYFPANVTIPAILGFYGDFYGIRFDRIQGPDADALSPTGNGSDLVWNEDVLMYALWDTQEFCDAYPDGIADDGFRGYLYLDLFYREGVKDGQGAYEQGLYPQYLRPDGSRSYASVTAVTNFEKSEDENVKPSLLEFGDLPTIMHELGHCMHDLLSSTSYTRTWGTQGVPIDFVEFPSQFMENFARVPEALKRISYHWSAFSDAAAAEWEKEQGANFTGELPPVALPDDLITHTINATNVLKGLATMNQIFYATYDQALHGVSTEEEAQALDPTVVYNQLFRNITGVPDPTDIGKGFKWSNGETDFTHLVSQYAGNYYAYQWCLVYAEDMFYTKFITDPFNTEASFAYRTTVLQPGGARDPLASLTEYLGRAPNSEGYYQYLGIDGDSSS